MPRLPLASTRYWNLIEPDVPSLHTHVAETGRPGSTLLAVPLVEPGAVPELGTNWIASTLVSSKTCAPHVPACLKSKSSDSERIRFQA